MSYDMIRVNPVTPRIGAEIAGMDLARSTNRQVEEIHAAYLAGHVWFFRDRKDNRGVIH